MLAMSVSQFTVNIELIPPLNGLVSELWYFFNDPNTGEEVGVNTGLPIPVSADGVISFAATLGIPTSFQFILVIPEQTKEGVTVLQTLSNRWLGAALTVHQVLPLNLPDVPEPPSVSLNPLILGGILLLGLKIFKK